MKWYVTMGKEPPYPYESWDELALDVDFCDMEEVETVRNLKPGESYYSKGLVVHCKEE